MPAPLRSGPVACQRAVTQFNLQTRAKGQRGRPSWPTEVMVRVLLLQQLYNLSDDALEYQLLDRCSVVRFVGLEGSGNVPDAKTIWVWRERLKNKHVIGDISAAIRGATGARRLHCPWWVDHRCPMPDARCS
ncbi:hypothetical protein BRM61_16130 [Xanthomonas oryzae pv. oryzae]|nr:transposase [Xanthomonas oryzae pv. oryzae PXO86]RBF82480.1 hypothetical protein BRM95_18730 [Xanthomonas oryzae pv. oryzae]RBG21150.1 hypothetical protein BRM58_19705 [Xanthomonas oryzae pv. oryzae]RBG71207.1 hypothetical protein BRM61_16130 [Xanthomonas oryzae pv. oryzae]RBJ91470.1 hypothetical protein BRN98_16430 [Xanthomonas oryzae pv. oryzae]